MPVAIAKTVAGTSWRWTSNAAPSRKTVTNTRVSTFTISWTSSRANNCRTWLIWWETGNPITWCLRGKVVTHLAKSCRIAYTRSRDIITATVKQHTVWWNNIPWNSWVPLTKRLIKKGGTTKHVRHIYYLTDVPFRQIMVKKTCSIKHEFSICHIGDIPATYVFIHCWFPIKKGVHICNSTNIPAVHSAIQLQPSIFIW